MVEILMATYNGARFLKEQIESILGQTDPDWHLIIRDDGSQDGTVDLIRAYEKKRPGQITLLCGEKPSGSAQNNFFELMKLATQDLVMFCDQDDVWLPDKIAVTRARMEQAESEWGRETPLLVHTDLQVVDDRLEVISPSFFRMQKLNPRRCAFHQLLVQNTVTGCTAMINRALLRLVRDNSPDIMMHDWWLGLIASCFGKVIPITQPTILYRQHSGNAVGAGEQFDFQAVIKKVRGGAQIDKVLRRTLAQGRAFLAQYGDEMSPENRFLLEQYLSLEEEKNKLKRIGLLIRHDFWKHSLIRRLGQIYKI